MRCRTGPRRAQERRARHTHNLLAGGFRALEHLFPGIELDLFEVGDVLASLLESRRSLADPLDGLGEAFLAEIQPLLETPWAVAMADLVYPQTRGERAPDLEKKLQYTHALMRLTAEDAEADKILAEVRSLLKPASALHEPELARRVMAMMALA